MELKEGMPANIIKCTNRSASLKGEKLIHDNGVVSNYLRFATRVVVPYQLDIEVDNKVDLFANRTINVGKRTREADSLYDDGKVRIIGEGKVSVADLTSKTSYNAYCDYVADLCDEANANKTCVLLLWAPFGYGGIARSKIDELKRDFEDTLEDNVHFLVVSEIDCMKIPAPENMETVPDLKWRGKEYLQINDKMIPAISKYVAIQDLKYDVENARIIETDRELNQEDCVEKLLRDGDRTKNLSAIRRRMQFLSGCIREPLIVQNGVVYEGNSRLAYAQYFCSATNNNAPGYNYVRVLEPEQKLSREELCTLKHSLQNDVKLGHGKLADAEEIYHLYKTDVSVDEISKMYGEDKYSVTDVKRYISAMEKLYEYGYFSDSDFNKLYEIAYALEDVRGETWSYWRNKKYNKTKRVNYKNVLDTMYELVNFDSAWSKIECFKHVVKLLQVKNPSKQEISLLYDLLRNDDLVMNYRYFKLRLDEAKEKKRKNFNTKKELAELKRVKTCVEQSYKRLQNTSISPKTLYDEFGAEGLSFIMDLKVLANRFEDEINSMKEKTNNSN